jgi:hypothetical protein
MRQPSFTCIICFLPCFDQVQWQKPIAAAPKNTLTLTGQARNGTAKWDVLARVLGPW